MIDLKDPVFRALDLAGRAAVSAKIAQAQAGAELSELKQTMAEIRQLKMLLEDIYDRVNLVQPRQNGESK